MGRNKVDTSTLIENPAKRCIVFSKRKRGLLKKAIEISRLCGWDIYMCMKDRSKNRVVEFQTREDYGIPQVQNCLKGVKGQQNTCRFEKFTNNDYGDLSHCDFREMRQRKKALSKMNTSSSEISSQGDLEDMLREEEGKGLGDNDNFLQTINSSLEDLSKQKEESRCQTASQELDQNSPMHASFKTQQEQQKNDKLTPLGQKRSSPESAKEVPVQAMTSSKGSLAAEIEKIALLPRADKQNSKESGFVSIKLASQDPSACGLSQTVQKRQKVSEGQSSASLLLNNLLAAGKAATAQKAVASGDLSGLRKPTVPAYEHQQSFECKYDYNVQNINSTDPQTYPHPAQVTPAPEYSQQPSAAPMEGVNVCQVLVPINQGSQWAPPQGSIYQLAQPAQVAYYTEQDIKYIQTAQPQQPQAKPEVAEVPREQPRPVQLVYSSQPEMPSRPQVIQMTPQRPYQPLAAPQVMPPHHYQPQVLPPQPSQQQPMVSYINGQQVMQQPLVRMPTIIPSQNKLQDGIGNQLSSQVRSSSAQ